MRSVITLALFCLPAFAGTNVADTIKDASGRAVAHGSVTFTPTGSWEGVSNANWVSQAPVSATITNGAFSVNLEPTPAGQCYTLTFQPSSISTPLLAGVPTNSSTLSLTQIIGMLGCVSSSGSSSVSAVIQVRNESLWAEYTGLSTVASGSLSISGGVATYVSGTVLADSMLYEVFMIAGVGYQVTTVTDVGGVANSLQFTPVPADGTVSYTIGNSWTLAHTPNVIGTTCWYNGIHQLPTTTPPDYTLTGAVITSVYWNPTLLTASPACDYQYTN